MTVSLTHEYYPKIHDPILALSLPILSMIALTHSLSWIGRDSLAGKQEEGVISGDSFHRGWRFLAPTLQIRSVGDIERFLSSRPGVQLEQFIADLGYSVSGKSVSDIRAEVRRAGG